MKKALKICVGIAAIGYVVVKAFAVGEVLPMGWALYKGDDERGNACAAAIEAYHGKDSEWTNFILDMTVYSVNMMYKLKGDRVRVERV